MFFAALELLLQIFWQRKIIRGNLCVRLCITAHFQRTLNACFFCLFYINIYCTNSIQMCCGRRFLKVLWQVSIVLPWFSDCQTFMYETSWFTALKVLLKHRRLLWCSLLTCWCFFMISQKSVVLRFTNFINVCIMCLCFHFCFSSLIFSELLSKCWSWKVLIVKRQSDNYVVSKSELYESEFAVKMSLIHRFGSVSFYVQILPSALYLPKHLLLFSTAEKHCGMQSPN